jgi:hypothetical protein
MNKHRYVFMVPGLDPGLHIDWLHETEMKVKPLALEPDNDYTLVSL